MPKLSAFKQRIGRILRPRHHAKTVGVVTKDRCESVKDNHGHQHSFDTDETLRLSESELSLNPSVLDLSCEEEEEEEVEAATKTSTDEARSPQKSVSFSRVTVRHYERILGENPGCRYPLSIGWNYQFEEQARVDDYEDRRAQEKQARKPQNKVCPRLYIPPRNIMEDGHYVNEDGEGEDHDDDDRLLPELTLYERRMVLRKYGYSEQYLRDQERQRQCRTALEWGNGGTPRFPHCDKFIERYSRQ